MATTTKVLTFAEFEQLPWPESGKLELRNGEVFQVAPPKNPHYLLARKLRRLLDAAGAQVGEADTEFAFRLEDHQYRIVDVAFLRFEDWAALKSQDYSTRAPELVIEILSPSNTATEMNEKRKRPSASPAVRGNSGSSTPITATSASPPQTDGHGTTYKSGQQIPLLFGGFTRRRRSFFLIADPLSDFLQPRLEHSALSFSQGARLALPSEEVGRQEPHSGLCGEGVRRDGCCRLPTGLRRRSDRIKRPLQQLEDLPQGANRIPLNQFVRCHNHHAMNHRLPPPASVEWILMQRR